MKRFLLLSVVASVVVGGCTTPGTAGTQLAGTQWAIVRIDGQLLASPDRARLSFDDKRLSANVGCNGMGGDYRVEGGRIIAGPMMATRMFCEGPVWQQEQAVNALLSGAPEMEREGGTLRLKSGGHMIEAQRLPVDHI